MILPTSAQKIRNRIAVEDQRVIADGQSRVAERQRLNTELADARTELQRLDEASSEGRLNKEERHGFDDDGDQIVKKVRDPVRLAVAADHVKQLEEQLALTKPKSPVARLGVARLDHGLAKFVGTKLIEVERPKLPLAKGETAADALPRFREAALALRAERSSVSKAPRTKEEVKAALRRELGKLENSFPSILPAFHGAKIAWPQHTFAEGRYSVTDPLAVLAFLLRDELESRLCSLIDFNASAFPDAMAADDKAERLAELDAEIDVAERLEAACVEQIIADGGIAHHRPDCSALAVLSLRAD